MSGNQKALKRTASVGRTGGKRRANSTLRRIADQVDEQERELIGEDECDDQYSDIEDDGEVVDAGSDAEDDAMAEEEDESRRMVFRPGVDAIPEGAEMTYDSSAYDMYHKLQMDWPCLSFDIVTDSHGASRTKYPLQCFWACGSQAAHGEENCMALMKSSQLCRTRYDDEEESVDDDDDEDDDQEDLDMDPVLESKTHAEASPYTRIRTMPQQPTVIAGWTEAGVVKVYDFADQFKQLDNPGEWVRENAMSGGAKTGNAPRLLFSTPHGAEGHTTEGFGLAWSPLKRGSLATGDCEGQLRVWTLTESGTVASNNLTPNAPCPGSIEDIQWSSTQENVFITAQAGGQCQVFDARTPNAKLSWEACKGGVDVNVLSWNAHRLSSHLIATGNDDGSFYIWDLRRVMQSGGKNVEPVQAYTFLQAPVTSIEWSPTNENLLAVASDDNQVTLWDFSIERDAEEEAAMAARHPELAKFPAQLVFQHMGLQSPKELHWHPQLPGVVIVTDSQGFDVFRPSNWKSIVH